MAGMGVGGGGCGSLGWLGATPLPYPRLDQAIIAFTTLVVLALVGIIAYATLNPGQKLFNVPDVVIPREWREGEAVAQGVLRQFVPLPPALSPRSGHHANSVGVAGGDGAEIAAGREAPPRPWALSAAPSRSIA